jgi:DNA primase
MIDFSQTVKQQADIVKVIEGYIRLRRAGRRTTQAAALSQGEVAAVFRPRVDQFYHCMAAWE